MKIRTIGYWVATGLVALAFAAGGMADLMGSPNGAEVIAHLGYPAYFATLIGVWKVFAVPAILVPGAAHLKEWAYAGIFFDLSGAAVSHLAVGDGADKVAPPLVLLAIVAVSWALRPDSRKLQSRVAVR